MQKKETRILSRFAITIELLLLGTKYRYKFVHKTTSKSLLCRINSRNSKNRRRIETSLKHLSKINHIEEFSCKRGYFWSQFMWRHHCLLGANFERVEYFPPKTRVFMRILGVEKIKTAFHGMKCPFLSSDRNETIVNRFQNFIQIFR